MRQYDFELAKKIIETFASVTDVESVSMGMQEDWFWTAEEVWENGEFAESFKSGVIAGISGSAWATPVIQVDLKNGDHNIFNCYTQDDEGPDMERVISEISLWSAGCLSGPITAKRLGQEIKDFKK